MKYVARLATGEPVAADSAARAKAKGLGDPQGALGTPMVTQHTYADPLVIVQNESWYAARAAARGSDAVARLVRLVTVPPRSFPEKPGAPYGAGHCNFTVSSRVGIIKVLDDWVREGTYPGAVSVAEAFGAGSGLQPDVQVPAWPAGGPGPTSP